MRTPGTAGLLLTVLLVAALALTFVYERRTPPRQPETAPAHGGTLTAAFRGAASFDPLEAGADEGATLVRHLTAATLLRIDRTTFELEPALAERWTSSADARMHTMALRRDVRWSDGTPFTAADVLFSLQALIARRPRPALADTMAEAAGRVDASAPDAHTVVFTLERPSVWFLSVLDALPMLPRHTLAARLDAGSLVDAFATAADVARVPGLGPFLLQRQQADQTLVFARNPEYWEAAPDGARLPFLEALVLERVTAGDDELQRLTAGTIDIPSGTLRLDDYARARQAEGEGQLVLLDAGVSLDADALWFCLRSPRGSDEPHAAIIGQPAFRQALSHAVDREAFAHAVFGGHAVPVWGPMTPGHGAWFTPNVPRYRPDRARAQDLVAAARLEARGRTGPPAEAGDAPIRLRVLADGSDPEALRGLAVIAEEARRIGVELEPDVVEAATMARRVERCDYTVAYGRVPAAGFDPAARLAFWRRPDGGFRWHAEGAAPVDWERRLAALLDEQKGETDPVRRRALVHEVQVLLGEQVPILFVAAPRQYVVHAARVSGVRPSVAWPPVLWSPERLAVRRQPAAGHAGN